MFEGWTNEQVVAWQDAKTLVPPRYEPVTIRKINPSMPAVATAGGHSTSHAKESEEKGIALARELEALSNESHVHGYEKSAALKAAELLRQQVNDLKFMVKANAELVDHISEQQERIKEMEPGIALLGEMTQALREARLRCQELEHVNAKLAEEVSKR